jgi:hypothetical protein
MVVDLQLTPPKLNTRKIYPDNNELEGSPSRYYRDQLAIMKENLLNPAEVTFKEVQDNGTRRKRLTTISSETSDIESVTSASTTKEKKKIPDGE